MELALDIGSTELTVGYFVAAELRARWRLSSDPRRTPDETGLLLGQLLDGQGIEGRAIERISYASVLPVVSAIVEAACKRTMGREAIAIDGRTPLPIRIEVDEPLGVGADRLANAVAAHHLNEGDVLVVDLGTASTYDCVTADGSFIGGAIAPGVLTAADRLSERTARLPRVALAQPIRVIGRRTQECLQSGIFFGAVDAIDGMVRRIREEWGRPDLLVIATGGLSASIAPYCHGIHRVDPDLTLHGIRIAREYFEHVGNDRSGSPASGTDRASPA